MYSQPPSTTYGFALPSTALRQFLVLLLVYNNRHDVLPVRHRFMAFADTLVICSTPRVSPFVIFPFCNCRQRRPWLGGGGGDAKKARGRLPRRLRCTTRRRRHIPAATLRATYPPVPNSYAPYRRHDDITAGMWRTVVRHLLCRFSCLLILWPAGGQIPLHQRDVGALGAISGTTITIPTTHRYTLNGRTTTWRRRGVA